MEYGRVGGRARTLRWLKIGDILFWGDYPDIIISQISACPINGFHCLRLSQSCRADSQIGWDEHMSPILPVAAVSGDRVKIQGCQRLEVYPWQIDFVICPSIQPTQDPIIVPRFWMVFENLPNVSSDCFL